MIGFNWSKIRSVNNLVIDLLETWPDLIGSKMLVLTYTNNF